MKSSISLFLLMIIVSSLVATQTANSLAYSGSFMLRAQGSEALYWNPAALNQQYRDVTLPLFNQSYQISNSAFDIDTYNYISGRYLTEADKVKILKHIDNAIVVNANTHIMLLGFSLGNIAFASSIHGYSEARISEDYIKLLLTGNEESDYYFGKKDNQLSAISYQDITIGIGDIDLAALTEIDNIPHIKFGIATSLLTGLGVVETDYYKGLFHSGFDGMSVSQDVIIKTGIGGIGHKSLISLYSKPLDYLTLGMSFDNMLGYIKWFGRMDATHYSIEADSVYASDLQSDIFTETHSTKTTDSFVTKLPPEIRLGALGSYKDLNLSIDWVQGFANSQVTSSIGTISVGSEYYITPKIPIRAGLKFGNRDYPWSLSYGTGYTGKHINFSIGLQSFSSVIPGQRSKGVSFASSISLHN
jgi:hypothetical protein